MTPFSHKGRDELSWACVVLELANTYKNRQPRCSGVQLPGKYSRSLLHIIYFSHYGSGSSQGVSFTLGSCTVHIPPHTLLRAKLLHQGLL